MSISLGIHQDEALARAVRDLALEDHAWPAQELLRDSKTRPNDRYGWLREAGSRLWLDTGDAEAAEKVWAAETEAVTTNNTLVNQVVQTGAMDGTVTYAARRIRQVQPDIPERDLVIEIGFLVNARLALGLVSRFGAHVSVELHPDFGEDLEGTLTFARRYYQIDPDHFYIKVPMTPDGFVAVRQLSAEGIPVNYTLGFSARQNYLAARFSRPAFVNVFLGRLNQLVEENDLGDPENVGEKAALASDEAVKGLRDSEPGLRTMQIAASMRNGRQVMTLAGIDVLTIPPKAAAEYLEMDITRGDIRPRLSEELTVTPNPAKPVEAGELATLWEIEPDFVGFVQDAVSQADQIGSGRRLVDLSREHGVTLFHDWSADERARLREKGKIPDVSQWPGVPVDDLMSMSALEAFAKDQLELDERIARLIR